jgi:acyl dehydratase
VKFEEFSIGQEFVSMPYTVSGEELAEYARYIGPGPTGPDGGTSEGGVDAASGLFAAALAWRLWVDLGIHGDDGRGGLGVDELRWSESLRPGTTVRAHIRIAEHRLTSQGAGLITYEVRLCAEGEAEIVRFRTTSLVARQGDTGGVRS